MLIYKSFAEHEKDVRKVASQIGCHKKNSLKKNSSNTLRSYPFESQKLDISFLNQIIFIDPDQSLMAVEPRMTFEKLCTLTLSEGFLPLVVPEFKNITVGGAIMGAALESSSHRFGQFNDTCEEYECILGNGDVILASGEKNADLFYAIPGSYGSLAIISLIKVRIKKAKKFVSLHIKKFEELSLCVDFLCKEHPKETDYLEGIVFNKSNAASIEGKLTNDPDKKIYKPRNWSPWYYEKVEKSSTDAFCIPLKEYLFRYDKGAFWMGSYIASLKKAFRILINYNLEKIILKKSRPPFLLRLLFQRLFNAKTLYRLWHSVPLSFRENLFFIHDFYAPAEVAEKVLNTFLLATGIFPIWLCPVKGALSLDPFNNHPPCQFLSPHYNQKKFLNLGFYGIPQDTQTVIQLSQELEKKIIAFGGRKMLYSFSYYEKNFFEKIYEDKRYNLLREKYSASQAFFTLYDKVVLKPK